MLIGLISDIHGELPEQVHQVFEGVDRILCAGDCEDPRVLWELESIAPTIAVLGNCDRYMAHMVKLHGSVSPKLGGVKFFMTHRPADIGVPAKDVQVVVFGHTHIPKDQMRQGVRYINPGSACFPRACHKPSVALMRIEDGQVRDVSFVELEQVRRCRF